MPADWQLPAGVSRAMWDYFHDPGVARAYDQSLENTPLLNIDQAFVLEHCQPPGKLIDLGAGTGRLSIALAQQGYRPLAVDLSPEMLKILREKAAALNLDVPCLCANLVELNMLADCSFEHAACLFSTLGLLVGAEARMQFIGHVHRVLNRGGVFVVHVHNRWFNIWTAHGRRLLLGDIMGGTRGDYVMPPQQGIGSLTMHLFTRGEIVRLLQQAGFTIVEVRPISLNPDGRMVAPWWFGRWRAYGYLIAARKSRT